MGQPDFHRTWHRSLLAPKGMQSFCPSRLSCCHMAEQEISVTGEGFAIAGDREVCTICKGLLPKHGCSRIVHRHKCAVLVSSCNEDRKITYIQTRITGRFQPEECCTSQVIGIGKGRPWQEWFALSKTGETCSNDTSRIAHRQLLLLYTLLTRPIVLRAYPKTSILARMSWYPQVFRC